MHIGVDGTFWQNMRGYGRQGRGLMSALVNADTANRYTFVVDSTDNLESVPRAAEVRLVSASRPTSVAASADGHRSLTDMWQMSRAMSSRNFDLLLFPTIYSYVPVFSRAKKVVIIHDVIGEKYPQLTLPRRSALLFWKIKTALGRWQADAIVTVSEFSRQALLKTFPLEPENVFVVGEASDSIFRVLHNPRPTPHLESLGFSARSRSIVYVGGFAPHKNLEPLVSGFAKLAEQEQFDDVRLVMVGKTKEVFHSCLGTIKEQIARLGIADRVVFTDYLSDEELVVLLNLSTVLILPSLMEGFGLPAIEAAACGCPVIVSTATPMPDLLGDAGLYIDPNRPEELERALVRVLTGKDLRRHMREAGLRAARQLTWEAAALQMMNVIRKVVRE
jgi:glycosyltransferase involved in cell wall biosynthesis